MKITFIKHSCYTVETNDYFLVFDYIGGNLNIPQDKKLIFFVSHRHGDHFSSEIFKFNAYKYIISNDTIIPENNNTIIVEPYNTYTLNDLIIKTTGSTDEGVAFYVNVNNIGLIHSGDLNHWVWDRYSTEDRIHMKKWFEKEVDYLKNEKTDIAMIVVDPRMKENYYLTGEYFLKNIDAKYFFPMHMWEDFSISEKFKNKYEKEFPNKKIMVIHHDNEEFLL